MAKAPNEPKKLSRKRGFQIIEGCFDPYDKGEWDLYLPDERIDRAPKMGKWYTPTLGYCLPYVLKQPSVVYEGLKRDGEPGGLCYIGQPPKKYPAGRPVQPRADEEYFVFVRDRVAYDSDWEENLQMPKLSLLAEGNEARFDRRLHP